MSKEEAFWECYHSAAGCSVGDGGSQHAKAVPFKTEDVAEILHAEKFCCCGWGAAVCDTWCDSGSVGVAKLKDGRFGTVWEDADTSGHG